MRIILINLARAADRRAKMQAQFDALGLPFEILEATDGRSLTDAERGLVDHDKRQRITPYPLSDNEIGCWLSHRRAMARVAESQDRMGVVAEDDIALTADFGKVLTAIEQMDTPFDFIFLHRKFKKGEVFAPCRPLLPSYNLGRIGYGSTGAFAYVASREGARKFIARTPRFAHAVDKEMHSYWANGLDLYNLDCPVAEHADDGHSYINETRGHDRPKERARYPDADALRWRWRRFLTRITDSLWKRLAFPRYVHQGRQGRAA